MGTPYIGEIRMFGGSFAPVGWAYCMGQLMPISENDALFNLIGTTYGGDGQETFGLPNLSSRIPVHQGTGPDGQTYVIGEMSGVESVTLTTQQIPIHKHAPLAGSPGNAHSPANTVFGIDPIEGNSSASLTGTTMNTNLITVVGGSQPHENLMPYLCISFIISLYGVFPTQN